MRREKSLRIGVHLANAVVWGPEYRTHLSGNFAGSCPKGLSKSACKLSKPWNRTLLNITKKYPNAAASASSRRSVPASSCEYSYVVVAAAAAAAGD
jgi:hypothetical protein